MTEEWRPIVGFDDYLVSSLGRVWSKKSKQFLNASIRSKRAPYLSVHLKDRGRDRNANVHRLVAEAFLDNPSGKPQVNHIDGDKQNNRLDNLEWATASENAVHAYASGLRRRTPSGQIEIALSARRRKVRIVETGEVFASVSECAKAIGGQHTGVSKYLRGDRPHYMGYHFAYAD